LLCAVFLGACGSEESNPFGIPSYDREGNLRLQGQVKLLRYPQNEQESFRTENSPWNWEVYENGEIGSSLVQGKITKGNLDLTLPGTIPEEKLPQENLFFNKLWNLIRATEAEPLEISNDVRGAALSVYVASPGSQAGAGGGIYSFKNGEISGKVRDFTNTTVELIYVSGGTRLERAAFSLNGEDSGVTYTLNCPAAALNLSRGWNFIEIKTRRTLSGSHEEITWKVSKLKGLRNWLLY
jgi:hypothetical protein